ncbi:MAG: HEAT repeat domain-containing protein [Candidatus Wallbacteria bacterium]|nr:HEAT repeat domain-containing protein [Candidatus Wallbacteria bacterium]
MNKKQVLIVMAVIIAVSGTMLFIGRGKSQAPATPQRITKAPVAIPKTVPPAQQPSATSEIAQAATGEIFSGTIETALAGGTEEIDLDKIVWAREYLRKYKGKISADLLKGLNDLIIAGEKNDQEGFLKRIHWLEAHSEELVEPIADLAIDDKNGYLQVLATDLMRAVSSVSSKLTAKPLIALSKKGRTPQVRNQAIQGLQYVDCQEAYDSLYQIASDRDDEMRELALSFLWKDKSERSKHLLIDLLKDTSESQDVKLSAAYSAQSFMKLADDELIQTLIDTINNKELQEQTRGAAILSLSRISPQDSILFIEEGIKSNDDIVQLKSMQAIKYVNVRSRQMVVNILDVLFCKPRVAGVGISDGNRNVAVYVLTSFFSNEKELILETVHNRFSELANFEACSVAALFIAFKDATSVDMLRKRAESVTDSFTKGKMISIINELETIKGGKNE